MPSTGSVAAFALLSLVLIVVPGPSVMFVVGRAVTHGRRPALVTVVGNGTGVYVQVVLVALGLGAVVERSVAAFTIVKLVGAAYLIHLGVQAIRRRDEPVSPHVDADAGPPDLRGAYRDGFVVGVANPKAIVFFAAILPQFVDGRGPVAIQMALLGIVFVLIALVADSAWALAAGTVRDWFARAPRRQARLHATGGASMIGLGVHLALTGRE